MFWDIFAKMCQSCHVSPNAVARAVGVKSTGTVSAWKNGAMPRDGVLLAIADYFGVTREFMLGLTPESYRFWADIKAEEVEKAYNAEKDSEKKYQLALQLDALHESINDSITLEMMSAAGETKKAPTKTGERKELTDDGYHIGALYDIADEKDKMLAHSVLDKYADEVSIESTKRMNPGQMIEIDVFDEPAAAGFGNYLDYPTSRREQFPSIYIPRDTDFGIRISGNSMEPAIKDGTTVFVKQTIRIDNKKVGIFVLNGASYCKQLIVDHENKEVRLHSLNPEYADIIVHPEDDFRTIGQVL